MYVSRRGCLPFGPHFDTPIGNINDWTLPAPAVCEHAAQQFEHLHAGPEASALYALMRLIEGLDPSFRD